MALKIEKEMNPPQITEFDDYPGQIIKGLKPSAIKWSQTGNSLRIKLPQARVVEFFSFSKNGVTESKKGGKYFLRFNADGPDVSGATLYTAIEAITFFCVDVWRSLRTEITKRLMGASWNEDLIKTAKVNILSGAYEVAVTGDDENDFTYTCFLHKTYTKCYVYDGLEETRKPTSVARLTGKSGNSHFHCNIHLKTVDVEYDPLSNLFSIKVFINANDLVWIFTGQKSDINEQEEEETKKIQEANMIKKLGKFVEGTKKNKRKQMDATPMISIQQQQNTLPDSFISMEPVRVVVKKQNVNKDSN